jgi:hypothetical protein
MKNQLVFCERCKAKLAEHRNGEYNIVWLVLDQRTGTYTDKEIPDEFSQGAFPFGRDCAKVVLAEHEATQHGVHPTGSNVRRVEDNPDPEMRSLTSGSPKHASS